MADPLVTYSTRKYLNTTSYDTIDGTGYRIGDDYVLTAGHVYFEWNRDSTNTVLNDIWAAGSNFLDYRQYRSKYLEEVQEELSNGSPYALNRAIEGRIGARDTIVIRRSGDLGSSGDGLVVFLDHADLTRVESVLGVTASVSRIDTSPGATDHGTVVYTTSAGNLFFSSPSVEGDSGGAYLLSYDDREYVIGTHAGNTTDHGESAVGTYFTYSEWEQINVLLEAGHSGNVTSSEPTNLVVGKAGDDVIAGSFRADILLGRGGDDHLMDGDAPGDTVWANDTLIGGANNDRFATGAGDDTIWGGDRNSDQGIADGTDTVDYSAAGAGITIRFNGTGATSSLTVQDGVGGTDTLHSIEKIVGSRHADRLEVRGVIPPGFSVEIDAGTDPGDSAVIASHSATMIVLSILDDQGNGTLTTRGGRTITLKNFRTTIVGSAFGDVIFDASSGHKTIDGGAGDDAITVTVGPARIFGGAGDDVLTGGSGNDILYGEGGANEIHGGAGTDILVSANDAAYWEDGQWHRSDQLSGGAGSDKIILTGIGARAEGGAGDDLIELRGLLNTEYSVDVGGDRLAKAANDNATACTVTGRGPGRAATGRN